MSSRVLPNHEIKSWSITGSPAARRVAFVIADSVLAIVPVLGSGVPSSPDVSTHFRFALPFYDAIAHGNFYPGWLADSNGGCGHTGCRFYPPAVCEGLAVLGLVTGGWYAGGLVAYALISVGGG